MSTIVNLEQKLQHRILIFLWQWWLARNIANEGQKMASVSEVCSNTTFHLLEWEKLQQLPTQISQKCNVKWKPPASEFFKINCDASYSHNTGTGGWGCVIRNSRGDVLEVGFGKLQRLSSPLHAEAVGAMRSVEHAVQLGMTHIVLETDATILGEALRSSAWDRSPYGALFRQMRDLLYFDFTKSVISVCNRACNRVADSLAAYAASLVVDASKIFMDHVPEFVSPLVSGDKPGAHV